MKRSITLNCKKLLNGSLSLFLLLVVLFVVSSCFRNESKKRIALPSTPLITESKRWGVVNSNFIRLRLRPHEQGEILNGLSKGIVLEVLFSLKEPGAAPEDAPRWYQVRVGEVKGWSLASQIKICDSKAEAEELSRTLK